MLWRAMLRGTAVGLLTAAAQSGGATVLSSKDTPVPAETGNWFVVYADEDLEGEGGGAPTFRNKGIVTLEIRGEADELEDAEALLDTLSELARNALLRGQGFDVTLTVTNGSTHALPADGSPQLYKGFLVRGPGIDPGGDFVAIQTMNNDGSVELSAPYGGSTGEYSFNIGSFVALFEKIDKVQPFPAVHGEKNEKHIVTETLEFHGHVHEVFEPSITTLLNEIKLIVSSGPIPFPPETTASVEPQA